MHSGCNVALWRVERRKELTKMRIFWRFKEKKSEMLRKRVFFCTFAAHNGCHAAIKCSGKALP